MRGLLGWDVHGLNLVRDSQVEMRKEADVRVDLRVERDFLGGVYDLEVEVGFG